MAKSVTFAPNPRNKPSPEDLDAFVLGRRGPADAPSAPASQEASQPVPLAVAPPGAPAPVAAAAPPPSAPKAPMKRLTFDIPADLHRRIRINCVERGIDMAEDLRRILNEHYPLKS